jgi:hypothetical protein
MAVSYGEENAAKRIKITINKQTFNDTKFRKRIQKLVYAYGFPQDGACCVSSTLNITRAHSGSISSCSSRGTGGASC